VTGIISRLELKDLTMSNVQQFVQAAAVIAAGALWHVSLCAQEVSGTASSGRDPAAVASVEAAMKLLSQQKYREAITEVNSALKLDASFPEAYVVKGDILKATEDYQGAAKAYSDALNFNPDAAKAYNGRGEANMASGQFDVAIEDFRKAHDLDPNNAAILSNLGHLLVTKADDAANGLRVLNDAIALNDNDARAYRDRGLAHAQLREFNKAITDMQKAAKIDPDDLDDGRSATPALPPIDEGVIKVFRLRHADVVKTAEMVQSLFGVGQLRIAVDDRTNSLVAFGQAEPLKVVEAILMNLDQKSAESHAASEPKDQSAEAAPRSVMVRVFWLADSPNAGPPAIDYLPESVIAGVQKLGLKDAQLVAQSANTLNAEARRESKFSTFVPAQMGEQQVELQGSGSARWLDGDRIGLELNLQVMGDAQSQVGGSLAMPLNHYMVLGASNSVIQSRGKTAQKGTEQGLFVAEEQPAKAVDSRFAFVVQVVEAESYAGENSE
jgi:tetratricopeptide (TPR) repeat protein